MMTNLNDLGKEYALSHLEETDLASNPVEQFRKWITEAIQAKVKEPNAMALATVDADGQPHCRMMLLKYFDDRGFVFFSNYQSTKGHDLEHAPKAAMVFWWPHFERQVRIEGSISRLDDKHSDEYFAQRDPESNIAASLSKQSQVMTDKQDFVDKFEEMRSNIDKSPSLSRPPHWGGYVLSPERVEFWQGGPHRLHDRLSYEKNGDEWSISRLYP